MSSEAYSNPNLLEILKAKSSEYFLNAHVCKNASADSFYGSQGRISENFHDANEGLIAKLKENSIETLEMETFQLYHLASCSKGSNIHTAALTMVFGDRVNNQFLVDKNAKKILEEKGGLVCLETLITVAQ